MQNWYALWMQHNNRHRELVGEPGRQRLVNAMQAQQRSAASPPDGRAKPAAGMGRLNPSPSGALKPAH